jgi:hypothetical protein
VPIRNLWALEPDECTVAEELFLQVRPSEIYFPVHDVGVDLLVKRRKEHIGVQVKGSRYYRRNRRGTIPRRLWHSWHQVAARKLAKEGPDFYVFVTYLPVGGRHGEERFRREFLIVPTEVLRQKVRNKNGGKNGNFSFYFRFEGREVLDIRESEERTNWNDYSRFLNNWDQISSELG